MAQQELPQRQVINSEATLRFAPHVRFRFDEMRNRWMILAPEKLLLPDETAVEILKLIDGQRRVDTIIDQLADRFQAPRATIAADVIALLQDLADKGVMRS